MEVSLVLYIFGYLNMSTDTVKCVLNHSGKKVYSVAFEHQKTGDRMCLNKANYVVVNDTKLGIAPIVVERVGLSEYVFFNLKLPFPTNFLKSRLDKKYILFTWNRC